MPKMLYHVVLWRMGYVVTSMNIAAYSEEAALAEATSNYPSCTPMITMSKELPDADTQ